MQSQLFIKYLDAIRSFEGDPVSRSMLMTGAGELSVYYAPFDWVNPAAKVVLVGITPGKTQAINALQEAKRQLNAGASNDVAHMRAKQTGAFSGAMRPNLVAMLDHIGLNQWLGLRSCDDLFGSKTDLLQTASVLPFPTYLRGENYNGTPEILKTPVLSSVVREHFVPILRALPDAVYVPMGPVPAKVLASLVTQGQLGAGRVLADMPHPSGANAERIKYFLGQKPRAELSAKTDPDKLDAAREMLTQAVAKLPRR